MKIQIFMILLLLFSSCKQNAVSESLIKNLPDDLAGISQLLDSIHVEDQKYRTEIDAIIQEFGFESDEMKSHWNIIRKSDASNAAVVKQILDKHGWLSSEQVGSSANSALFLVIQHADQETQEEYLPMMRSAVKEGKANARSLALLEDRVGLGKGELQVYGSQVGTNQETGNMYVLPLLDPDKVNERRASVGLGTIEDYISHWDLEWNVEEYKKDLPKLMEEMKLRQR